MPGWATSFYLTAGDKRHYEPLWWMAGRYVEVYVQALAKNPSQLKKSAFAERRYPLEMDSQFACSDPRLDGNHPDHAARHANVLQ